MKGENPGNGPRVSRKVLGTILIFVVALGAVVTVAIPRFQTPRVNPTPPSPCTGSTCSPSPCQASTCSPSSCTGSTCPSPPPATKSPLSIYQISFFSALTIGTSLMVQFALTAQDHEFLAQDGNVTFAISDSQTNQTVYSEGFSVRGDQFVNLSTTGSQTPGYQWYIPLSQIGKLIYYSTGTAQLSFTASGKTFLDTDTNIKLPTLDNIETRQLYENMYQQSAITVEQSQAKGDFNVTLVKVGNWTHPLYFAWGPLVTVFRVDLTVTSISSQPAYLWLNHLFLLNNLGGNSTYDRSYLQLGEIDPGQTRTGFLFFSALNPDVTSITIVSTELKTPENIVYQFQVAI